MRYLYIIAISLFTQNVLAVSAPTNINANVYITANSGVQATVTFDDRINSLSSPVTYTVTTIPSGGTDINSGTNSKSHVITGLINKPYQFSVVAKIGNDTSDPLAGLTDIVSVINPQPSTSSGSWAYASVRVKRRSPNNMPKFTDVSNKTIRYAPIGTVYDPTDLTGDTLTVRIRSVGKEEPDPFYDNSAAKILDSEKVQIGDEYTVSMSALKKDVVSNGVIAGILVVPYKYHFVDHSITADSTTVGAYVGVETDMANTKISYFFSLGLNTIMASSQANSTASTSTNPTGLSYALGIAINSYDTAKIMYVCGKDQVSDSSVYQYNDKWWCMLGLGYSLR